jgi:Ran GTPase-activating protein (RanGAP) involved in mRNA processing and transport
VLDLYDAWTGPEGATLIAILMPSMGGLTELNIERNSIKDEGITAICNAVQGNKESKLAKLNVAGNNISPVGATAVAAMVAVIGGLTKISLARNELGEEGTKAICEALEQNRTLKELDISGNRFRNSNIGGTAGVKYVAKMLGVNGGLTEVWETCQPTAS